MPNDVVLFDSYSILVLTIGWLPFTKNNFFVLSINVVATDATHVCKSRHILTFDLLRIFHGWT